MHSNNDTRIVAMIDQVPPITVRNNVPESPSSVFISLVGPGKMLQTTIIKIKTI